jgi:alpha-1,3-rhamnosyl/mannosyltransferase
VHDLSFLRFPQFAEERNRRYLSARIRDTVARADAVIADSQSGAAEIVEDLGVPADRVVPIHLGIGPEFRRPSPEYVVHVLRRLAIDRPYLLTVGTVEPRKNLPFLVEVFERLTAFDGLLVIAGACGWKYEPILARMRRSPRADSIRYLEYADEADLPSLYAGAAVFLCASFYEGFGFPPLEAMACGTPVVSSPGGSLAEMLGDAAVLPDTFDAGRWTTEIELLLSDTDRRAQLIEAGAGRAASYTWDETARRTADLYRRVLS